MSVMRIARGGLGRSLLVVLLAAVLGASIGAAISFGRPATYTASTSMYVTPPVSSTPMDAMMGTQYALTRAQLYLELLDSEDLARRVADKLGTGEPPRALLARIDAASLHETPILAIQARGSSPDSARDLADAYLEELPAFAKAVERNSGLRDDATLTPVVLPVDVTSDRAGLTPWLPVIAGVILLGGVALLLVLWIRRRHPVVREPAAVRAALGVPFVAEVGDEPNQMARIQAFVLSPPRSARVLLLVSPRADDRLDTFTAKFEAQLQDSHIPYDKVSGADSDELSIGVHAGTLAVVTVAGVLDDPSGIRALSGRPTTAVIVARRGRTLLEDVVELHRHLSMLSIDDVRGVVVDRTSRRRSAGRGAATSESAEAAEQDRPWPTIDVLEEELRKTGDGSGR